MRLCLRSLFVAAALSSFSATAVAQDKTLTFAGEVPNGALEHFFIPFDVPGGTAEIEVRHDDMSEANVLDFGLEDPAGYRGWGGGTSEPAIVNEHAASRAYVPGPIARGTWKVVVGKANIASPPGHYQVEVVLRTRATLAAQTERRPYAPSPPLASESRWYAGDFHVHSRESMDASADLDSIANFAEARGLDFVELSDHNTVTQGD